MIQLRKLAILIAVTAIGLSICGQKSYAQYPLTYEYWDSLLNTTTCTVTGYVYNYTQPGGAIVVDGAGMGVPGGLVGFPFAAATWVPFGGGTPSTTITWYGPTNQPFGIPPGEWTYVSAAIATTDTPGGYSPSAYWTVDGAPCGAPPPNPSPVWGYVNEGNWQVVEMKLWSDAGGTTLVGTQLGQLNGTLLNVINRTQSGPIYVSWATTPLSSTPVPFANLNLSLTGFGPFTPIMTLNPIPPCLLNCPPKSNTLFSDLGTGANVYQANNGLPVSGTGAPGGTSYTEANQFQVTASGGVSEIDVAVGYVSGTNSFYVSIDTDNGGQPGTVLATFGNLSSNTDYGSCCGLVSITGISGLSLSTGTNYWVVIGPTAFSSTTSEEWNLNSTGATGSVDYSTNGGLTWNSNGVQTIGAFDILGSSGGKSMVKK